MSTEKPSPPVLATGLCATYALGNTDSNNVKQLAWRELAHARTLCFVGDAVSPIDVMWEAEGATPHVSQKESA
jgi:hypothetical protein